MTDREPVPEAIRELRMGWCNGRPDAWKSWAIPQYLD